MIFWHLIHWTGSYIGSGQAPTLEGAADQVRAAIANLPSEHLKETQPQYNLRIQRGE